MARVENLKDLTPDQRRLAAEIASTRGRVGGPFGIWLRTPAIAEAANRLGNTLRRDSHLDKRLFELMVLVIARHWGAQYEWFVHEPAAREAGLSEDVISALREGEKPAFHRDDEQLVYDVVSELNDTKTLAGQTYERALAGLGLELLIEFISAAAFYTMVAMMLNAFDVATPDGTRPLSQPGS
jgi:4-carboxymuconolactone decarboxylase